MNDSVRTAPRNPWPIIRFLAHSRSSASSRHSLQSGEKSKSATPRSKECLRNIFFNTEAQRHRGTERLSPPALPLLIFVPPCLCDSVLESIPSRRDRLTGSVLNSSNRGAADLGFFAVGNERHMNGNRREWRKRRIIGRIRLRRLAGRFRLASADFRVFRSKKKGWHAGNRPTSRSLRQNLK